jgi:hypothetical protein
VIAISGAFLIFSLLSSGCGNPEEPQITNVRLSYWKSIPDPDDLEDDEEWVPVWAPVGSGEVVKQSPVRVQGNITDNTAVVSPRITWIGERDTDEMERLGFTECSNGTEEFFECEMNCEETQEGFFVCNPLLPTRKLIRGDRFLFTFMTQEGETFELEVQVSEAQQLLVPDSEDDPILIEQDYRILRVFDPEGAVNPFLWSLLQRKRVGGPWLSLRSGDFLALESGDDSFQIAIQQPEGVELEGPPSATWRSLVKWNNVSFLNWDARTGDFVETFQIFDPRQRTSGAVIGQEGPPMYRFIASAQDVPDQKTEVYRSSEKEVFLTFSPLEQGDDELPQGAELPPPDLEVDGEDEDLIETSNPAENFDGTVESFSGEVRSLLYTLSEGPETSREPRFLYLDPEDISLRGEFEAAVVYVSDWDGDGVVDPPPEEGILNNLLEVTALDVQGNWTRKSVSISFVPTTLGDGAPELQILEILPTLDDEQEALLPFDEELRVRARAADDRGQPAFAAYQCTYGPENSLENVNEERCPIPQYDWDYMNAGGEYPRDPWEWIVIQPTSEILKTIGVLLAKEKVEDSKDSAKFTGIQIDLEPESEQEAYKISVSLPEASGPNVLLPTLKNGDTVDRDGLIVEATIFASISELNQITALWNGEPRGEPSFDSTKGEFRWDLQGETISEGDKICVGAISVTGHATLRLLEFAATTSEDLLLLGVTVTRDTEECVVQTP